MVRRTTTTIIALGLLVASPLMARRLTTTQMRENTIRINALELEEPAPEPIPEPVPEPPKEETFVFDSGRLNFDFDKSVVKPQYFELLRNVKDYAEQHDLRLTIIGHTDSKGSDAYNMALGMRRAVAVRDKLIEFGLDPARIIGVESRGESEPIAPNDTEQGRFENRRIEFKATK
ncbi:OmpA/MotB domain-containing protein [Leptotrichia trevisanii]|uniref:OmpA/MotB domain-containing protein n=1 Tax=Leptotrichia trevisanii TaxID=109328 RepID=A0A510KYW6_9FUSO|nr:OmpA family protein [Leptotrichia trevisanii]BBM51985.1 OmpA/MotB domain-containing protein [Leptotrichia trevisanii]BBM56930.1 OmpA/MotB domain-containing protein [Leptotrichia trevisanii]